MNWAMPPCIRSRIATAAAMGALVAISTLTAPTWAFAAQTPLKDPADSATDLPKLAYQTNDTNFPTSPDGPRCVQLPLSVSYHGDPDDDDDDDDNNIYIYY